MRASAWEERGLPKGIKIKIKSKIMIKKEEFEDKYENEEEDGGE
jgi:hypothetical protein